MIRLRYLYLLLAIIGIILASYGFSGVIDDRNKQGILRAGLLLLGIILLGLGLLLYGAPHFFSSPE